MPDLKQILNQFENTPPDGNIGREVPITEKPFFKAENKQEKITGGEGMDDSQSQIAANPIQAMSGNFSIGCNNPNAAREKQIEKILEKDLEEIYLSLSSAKKEEFKKAGEKTAREINSLLLTAKASADKIINLIKSWFSVIPGINRFFLEQEAKIKTDEILKLNKKL